MAKKTRKVLKQASQQRAIQQAAANLTTAAQAERAANPSVPAQTTTTPAAHVSRTITGLPEDYRYVKADLRRIGVLAVSFTTILIVLSFFIH
jgi:hypothetical protein